MKGKLLWAALALALTPAIGFSAPFLSSDVYPDTDPRPTEFIVSIDGAEDVLSSAASVKQQSTMTINSYDAGTTYRVTIGGANVDQVGTGGTTTTTATALTTALNASGNANFTPITWTSSGAVITGTHDTGGTVFTPTTDDVSGSGDFGDPVQTVDPDGRFLLYDLVDLEFGTHTYSVKAQNSSATSEEAAGSFDIGVQTPDIIVLPVAP